MKLEDKNSVEITVPPKARLIWGGLIFVIGFLSPLLIPWVISLDLSAGTTSLISGILALGVPELFMLIAVGILGKSGFDYLKQKLFSFLKLYIFEFYHPICPTQSNDIAISVTHTPQAYVLS